MNIYLVLGLCATALDLAGCFHYIRDCLTGKTKPHCFSWFVWSVIMAIGTAIAINQGAFALAIPLGVGAANNMVICYLGLRQGSVHVSKGDWVSLVCALSAIPVWLLTDAPLYAALIISAINMFGAYPTVRKAWQHPFDENLASFSLFSVSSILRLAATSPFTLTAAFYPATIVGANMFLSGLIFMRRASYKAEQKPA